ncbi:MAG: glycosyltransferase family 4 protein [Lachnospiraceae bacterium]|nr:glycosyltransferase family 4 protein [Lachnospiraceae bacterium]
MKRVCHVTSAHRRYDTRIFQKECRTLAKEGYEVYLLVNDGNGSEVREQVKIISTGFWAQNRKDRFFKSHKKLLEKALEINADIYHFHDPDLLFWGLRLKKKGKTVIFDSHEIVREDIMDKAYIPKVMRFLISKVYSVCEEYVLKSIDAVIGVDPYQMRLLNKIGNNATMITNYPECIEVEDREITKNGICFAGAICSLWSHEKILNILDKTDVKYRLCGVAEDLYLENLKKHRNWKYVDYKGVMDHEDVLGFLEESIAGMALLGRIHNLGPEGTLGNTKIFEYMRAGIPIIATDFPLWKRIINKYKCGICVDLDKEEEIIEAIHFICNNPVEARKMGENGRQAYMEKFNWDTQIPALVGLYKKLENHKGYKKQNRARPY